MSLHAVQQTQVSPPPALATVRNLCEMLHAEEIAYCHWKSNEHLAAAVCGKTDLDVLVDRQAVRRLTGILSEAGFKRFAAVPERSYPGIEDYLAMDSRTGALIHLHLHHQLTLGEKGVKGYRLPWEEELLATRRFDPTYEIYVADPHLEILLLIIRSTLKLRARDALFSLLGRSPMRGGALREWRWLQQRVSADQLTSVAGRLVGAAAAEMLRAILDDPTPSTQRLLGFRRRVRPGLHTFRIYEAPEALRRRWLWEWRARLGRISGRIFSSRRPRQRTLPQGGRVVALIGSDGAGKSTLLRDVDRWLSWKAAVVPFYFGSGDGPDSLLRRPLRLVRLVRMARHGRKNGRPALQPSLPQRAPAAPRQEGVTRARLRAAERVVWALTLSAERRKKLVQAQRARNGGRLVLCDRFPQNQIMGFTDGPLLSAWREHPSAVLSAVAQREAEAYELAEYLAPDLVIKLKVSPEVALHRKPDTAYQALPARVVAVSQLRFPPPTRVIEIDADRPLPDVLLDVKRAIWDII